MSKRRHEKSNLPNTVPGRERRSAEPHKSAAREGTAHRSAVTPNMAVDTHVHRAGLPQPKIEMGLTTRTDLGKIIDRAQADD